MPLTHFDGQGNARMVDVTEKRDTKRTATATGEIAVSREVFSAIKEGTVKKGDVLAVATTAGILGAKRTWEVIPMCHILPLTGCDIRWEFSETEKGQPLVGCFCTVSCFGKTGVEMEALNGVSTALLTVYDMCKAIDKGMEIRNIALLKKDGGKSGPYERKI